MSSPYKKHGKTDMMVLNNADYNKTSPEEKRHVMLMSMYMSSRLSASFTGRSRLKNKRFIFNYIFVYVGKDLYVFKPYFTFIILNTFKLSIQRLIPMIVIK